ncbi:MAG TPA: hypothetical protein VN788_14430, partial [Verrucomicrobiae bacterium]|nr:hypothetical protein [Verrucomicrobiae bacterium]
LALATAGVHGCIPVFWSMPGLYLSGTAAAGGIALISTIGNLAGAVGPVLLGYAKSQTGTFNSGLYAMSGLLVIAGMLVLTTLSRGRFGPNAAIPVSQDFAASGKLPT